MPWKDIHKTHVSNKMKISNFNYLNRSRDLSETESSSPQIPAWISSLRGNCSPRISRRQIRAAALLNSGAVWCGVVAPAILMLTNLQQQCGVAANNAIFLLWRSRASASFLLSTSWGCVLKPTMQFSFSGGASCLSEFPSLSTGWGLIYSLKKQKENYYVTYYYKWRYYSHKADWQMIKL